MKRMTAAEAVWYALADLHRDQPHRQAFDKRAIVEHAIASGYWDLQRKTLLQHLTQWVNAQSPSDSARAAYVVAERRGGPYRLVRQGDRVATHRAGMDRHPDPSDDARRRQAVQWYTKQFAGTGPRMRPIVKTIEVDEDAVRLIHAYAVRNGIGDAEAATVLLRQGLGQVQKKDPMLSLIGAAEGDATSGRDHDEVLYR